MRPKTIDILDYESPPAIEDDALLDDHEDFPVLGTLDFRDRSYTDWSVLDDMGVDCYD